MPHEPSTWGIDFEFNDSAIHCLVAINFATGQCLRFWADALANMAAAPFRPGDRLVAFYAPAEVVCFLRLGWEPSDYEWIDLYAEHRDLTNADPPICGGGLLDALSFWKLPGIGSAVKDEMRDIAIRGGPFTANEREELLRYCESDVSALVGLWGAMASRLDLPLAGPRGRYQVAAGRIEHAGIPIDGETWERLRQSWPAIRRKLIERVDQRYGVFTNGSFRHERFVGWLQQNGYSWPRTPTGLPRTDDETFRAMSARYPEVEPLRQLLRNLRQLRAPGLAVDPDGRARCGIKPFRSKTGRNQPSSSEFIFGYSAGLRSLIRPAPGRAVAYLDWKQQEFGIAASLSSDPNMMQAYQSGDPYLAFAKQAGAVPPHATKTSHPGERRLYKQTVLAVQYGQGAAAFAQTVGVSVCEARRLLDLHRRTYRAFWDWSDRVVTWAALYGSLTACFGWHIRCGQNTRETTLRNWPVQSNGAEMLRLACIFATEAGIRVAAPVHDALLIESSAEKIEGDVARTRDCMRRASEIVLDGFGLETDAEIVRYPDRYADERGAEMWNLLMDLLDEVEAGL